MAGTWQPAVPWSYISSAVKSLERSKISWHISGSYCVAPTAYWYRIHHTYQGNNDSLTDIC